MIENKIKVLIYGFGRMGLTHYAILNQLLENAEFTFVDPNKKVNYFARKNINAKIYNTDFNLNFEYDYVLICTPPMFHVPLLDKLIKHGCKNVFVEKPFGGINDNFLNIFNSNKNITVGYVLRFNPIIQWIKKYIDVNQITKVNGFYFSNTIEKKPKGWRNGEYSGVTNEVGAHIIDLCVYLFGLNNPDLIDKKLDSIISDVDDIMIANLKEGSISYHLHFDWVNKNYRKPVFKFEIMLKDGSIFKFDQQKIEHYSNNILINKITTVDLAENVTFYLRGIEFTNQMADLIGDKHTISKVNHALITRNLIKKLLS
jgi:predicted dehydrogenase